ncbi:Bud site selection protein bud4, partial [Teratosphaeriaceae sp. CCFEE 6253]
GVSSLYEDPEEEAAVEVHRQPVVEVEVEVEREVVIPERRATIKTGGKLKARPSVSRADLEALGLVNGSRGGVDEEPTMPEIPQSFREQDGERRRSRKMLDLDIPQLHAPGSGGLGLETEFDKVIEGQKVRPLFAPPLTAQSEVGVQQQQSAMHNHASMDADMPSPFVPHTRSAGTNAGKQKGYLMRQNTK